MSLSSRQRRYLQKTAHSLEPVVMIGREGLSPAVLNAVDVALQHHELIKLKFQSHKEDKAGMVSTIEGELKAEVVRIIGNIAILYRENPDEDLRRIGLPQ